MAKSNDLYVIFFKCLSMYLLILFKISEMFSSVSNKSIMLIKPSMIRALSAQAAPAAVSSSNKVRILCFGFSHNPLRFSLARETDTKMTRANHSSMAMGNLNKSKGTTPTATTALKVVP